MSISPQDLNSLLNRAFASIAEAEHARAAIGIDVVDLACAFEPPVHPRSAERIFTDAERLYIDHYPVKHCSVWAAKEAAYKAICTLAPSMPFIPRQFAFDAERQAVKIGPFTLPCRLEATSDYVAAICSATRESLRHTVSWIHPLTTTQQDLEAPLAKRLTPSTQVRAFLQMRLAERLEIDVSAIIFQEAWIPTRHGAIPQLGIPMTGQMIPCSFSHDGRFGASVVVLDRRKPSDRFGSLI